MGKGSIPLLLLHFSLPAIAGLVANALYNIVDRIFVGHYVGPEGIGALSVAFPFMVAISAVTALVGTGGASLLSRLLGENRRRRAERGLANALLLLLIGGGILCLLGSLFPEQLLRLSGSTESLLPLAGEYFSVILWGVPFWVTSMGMNHLIRSEGAPRYAMVTLFLGAGGNVILDWIFIAKLGMGITGAALGTVLAQGLAFIWVFLFYLGPWKVSVFRLYLRNLLPKWILVRQILAVGLSPFLLELAFTLLMGIFNTLLGKYGGDLAIASMGIFFSLDALLYLPPIGIGEGLLPIIGYNFGAKNYPRVRRAVGLALAGCVGLFTCNFLAVMFFAPQMAALFSSSSPELITLTARSLRIGYAAVPGAAVGIITTFTLQALGKARLSILISLSRMALFLVPAALILPRFFGVDGVWMSFPLADFVQVIFSGWFLLREMRRLERDFPEKSSGNPKKQPPAKA
jgi:putative MATE family efflux protein